MNIRVSVQNVTFRLPDSLFFLMNSKLAFSLIASQRYRAGTAKKKKRWISSAEQCKKELFASMIGNLFSLNVSLSLFLSQ